ncbi:hypothetical protein JOE31_001123 [Arthrobacter sp. PvP023]|nr:hypothetical protein [Arthrobacter sp. PvP023]
MSAPQSALQAACALVPVLRAYREVVLRAHFPSTGCSVPEVVHMACAGSVRTGRRVGTVSG